jgi:hypothetical protein
MGPGVVAAQLRAARWQIVGAAIVLHNGPVSVAERRRAALISCGRRSALTSFTAAEVWGLRGWERADIHVLVPAGTRPPRMAGLRLHRVVDWPGTPIARPRALHQPAPALVIAAGSLPSPRSACAILAAAVQQQLVKPSELTDAVEAVWNVRHRRAMLAALADIAQGSQSLSEIDFVRLCRTYHLPVPTRQTIRVEPSGRRRYLDVEWRLPDGRIVAVEVDGALHLEVQQWVADQLRHNEVVLGGTVVLRFPSVVVREEPGLVVQQLRRALAPFDR